MNPEQQALVVFDGKGLAVAPWEKGERRNGNICFCLKRDSRNEESRIPAITVQRSAWQSLGKLWGTCTQRK